MEIFGPGTLQPAFVGAEKSLTNAGHRLAVAFEQGPHLFDNVGQSDSVSETMRFDPSCPELRAALFENLLGDPGHGAPARQASRTSPPRQLRFLVLPAGHPGPSLVASCHVVVKRSPALTGPIRADAAQDVTLRLTRMMDQ
ncbi:hypothetical protein Sme01_66670 [Sphaerisporangium melleum]|uniref:Uncharacterized protein n=1 Tax=Sphaerisporangium melleum TaxID=321316 RepID=A0A917RH94_9ACTN|nr:hypothetical protein GCM10007964_55900 [Sphaerisporangium melleum]GII74191.1 hypothetical protein Sme01_66670 [Sphaerisporangium melleum]